jgi:Yip1 domain
MNRIAGIVSVALGVVVIALSLAKVVPGVAGTGVILILLGGLVIGLSFVRRPDGEGTPRIPTPTTLAAVFYAPTEVFRNLRTHPRWLVAVAVIALMTIIYNNAFTERLTPDRIVNYAIDKTKEMSFLNDEARANIESGRAAAIEDSKSPARRVAQGVSAFAGLVFLISFLSLIFWLFVLALGGQINFWQAFSASTYAMLPVSLIQKGLSLIILFIKDPDDIHPLIGQGSLVQDSLNFLVKSSENPVLFSLLSAFSLLSFYWVWLNGVGLKNAGERVSGTAAWSSVLGIWGIGIVFSVLMAVFFPSFLS